MPGVAIQGAGNVATEHIRAYLNNPHTRLVAIGSRTLESARKKAVELGVECDLYDNYDRLLEHPDVDVVSICTPPDRHAGEAIAAARAGKHLLIEKPVATNHEELNAMHRAVDKRGRQDSRRFRPSMEPADRLHQAGHREGLGRRSSSRSGRLLARSHQRPPREIQPDRMETVRERGDRARRLPCPRRRTVHTG